MKKNFYLFLFMLLSLGAQAQNFTSGDYKFTVTGENTVEVTGFADAVLANVVIPETVEYSGKTYTVTTIGRYSFTASYSEGPVSVTIPSTVVGIGEHAFFGSSSRFQLKTLNLSEGLKYIGEAAFYANGIEHLAIPASVDSIAKSAFLYSPKLETLTFAGEGLRYIGDGAFVQGTYAYQKNTTLTSVELPATVQYLGSEAFLNNEGLKSINIPRDLKTLGESVIGGTAVETITVDPANQHFVSEGGIVYNTEKTILYLAPLKGLTTLNVPQGVLGINGGAFWDADLQSITLPEGLVAIGFGAFENSQLSSINFPSTLVFVDEQAFAETKFTTLTLPENVPYINDAELYGIATLTSLTIPSSVKEIYNHALTGCTNLRDIEAKGSVAPAIMDYYDDYDMPFFNFSASSTTLTVPKGASDSYRKEGYDGYMKIVESDKGTLLPTATLPADGDTLNAHSEMSYELTFADELTLANGEPRVFIRKDHTWSSTVIEPLDGWKAGVAGNKLYVWGEDYDGYVDTMTADADQVYYLIIPADVVKNAADEYNEQIVIKLNGPDAQSVGIEAAAVSQSRFTSSGRYNLSGQKVSAGQKGISIVRQTDGKVKKIFVK